MFSERMDNKLNKMSSLIQRGNEIDWLRGRKTKREVERKMRWTNQFQEERKRDGIMNWQ